MQNQPRWGADAPWTSLPRLDRDMDAALCVVGLGGTGLTLIEEALDRGIGPVVGIDATDAGAGAAGRNGGLLLAGTVDFHHDAVRRLGRDEAKRWAQRTADEIDRFVARYPGLVRRSGSLRIAGSADELDDCQAQYAQMVADDLPVERYRGPEGEGLLFPQDAVFDPLTRCRVQATALLARGARLFGGTRAHEVVPGVVQCDGGRVRARHVVVCVDGALERVLPSLAGEVRTARLQMLATAPVAPRFPRPVYRRFGYDYWQQLPDGSICLGGGRDTAEADEWTHDAAPSTAIQHYLDRTLRDTLGVEAPVTHRWAALVSYTGTGLPVCRALGDGLWALGGYSGTGNVVGAVLAREVAGALR